MMDSDPFTSIRQANMAVGTRPYISSLDGLIALVFIRLSIESGKDKPVCLTGDIRRLNAFFKRMQEEFVHDFPVLDKRDLDNALRHVKSRGFFNYSRNKNMLICFEDDYAEIFRKEMEIAYGSRDVDLSRRRPFEMLVDEFRALVVEPEKIKRPLCVHR